MLISAMNHMFDHLLESSHRDDSNKWSNIRFGEEIKQVEAIEVYFMHLIWDSALTYLKCTVLQFPGRTQLLLTLPRQSRTWHCSNIQMDPGNKGEELNLSK